MATPTRATGRRGRATGERQGPDDQRSEDAVATSGGTAELEATRVPAAGTREVRSRAVHPRAAAEKAARRNSVEVGVPFLGTVRLPAPEELAFLAGLGLLAVVDVIEWPVALVLGAGHALASNRRSRVVREFGQALEEA